MQINLRLPTLAMAAVFAAILAAGAAAAAPTVSPAEMGEKDQWVKQCLLAPGVPQLPFSFVYDGKSSAELLKTWQRRAATKKLDDARTQHTIAWTDAKTGLEIRCVAVEYGDFPTVEWTLYFKNCGKEETPILAKIEALDTRIGVGGDEKFVLHHNNGTMVTARDFQPHATELPMGKELTLTPSQGRPCAGVWPYFNLQCGRRRPDHRRRLAGQVGGFVRPQDRPGAARDRRPGVGPPETSPRRGDPHAFDRANVLPRRRGAGAEHLAAMDARPQPAAARRQIAGPANDPVQLPSVRRNDQGRRGQPKIVHRSLPRRANQDRLLVDGRRLVSVRRKLAEDGHVGGR